MMSRMRDSFCKLPRTALLTGLLAALCMASPAKAGWFTSYDVTLAAGFPDVTNIILLERSDSGSSSTWAFTALGDPFQPNETLINNPFSHDQPPAEALLIGLATGLPGDGSDPQQHVVLMMNDNAAALANHISWQTLFRNTLEQEVIDDILLGTSGQDFPIVLPGIGRVNDFAYGDGDTGILGPAGIPQSIWFTEGSSFTVMAFSDGTVLGTGVSSSDFVPDPTATPEPSTAIAGLIGLGIGCFYLKRRRAAAH